MTSNLVYERVNGENAWNTENGNMEELKNEKK